MLVNRCKFCGKFIITGLENEYNETFCDEKCYKNYCESHTYTTNINTLTPFDTVSSHHS